MNGYHGEESSADDDRSVDSFNSDSDEVGSHSEDGSTEMSGGGNNSKTDEHKLAQKESKFVLCSKFMAYLVLFLSAVAAGIAAYYLTREQEVSDFEKDFNVFSRDITRYAEAEARSKIQVSQALSISFTSYAMDKGLEFPFVTLSDFEGRVAKAIQLSDSEGIGWTPFVNASQRGEWEAYTAEEGTKWIRNSLDSVGMENVGVPSYQTVIHGDTLPDGTVERVYGPVVLLGEYLSGMYAPSWQIGPISMGVESINMDALHDDFLRRSTVLSTKARKSAMSKMFDFSLGSIAAIPARAYLSTPIFSDFTDDAQVVGSVNILVGWENYFTNILPNHVKGIDVVLDDSCNKVYTFSIQGPNVTIMGEGDLHDRSFNSQKWSWDLTEEDTETFLVEDGCDYTVNVYPTKELEDMYLTSKPMFYAVAVAIIFIFTALVFLAYDWAVQLRQNKVLNAATRTQAIVSSLFPKNVQERIFRDVEEEVRQEEKSKIPNRGFRGNRTKDQLKTFLDDGGADGAQKHSGPASLKSKPIADLFPEATIVFADIVGFTAWSSTREPTQVFTLLENIYHSFDEIAKRRRIFKVETVGDCYVAVSGLPEPRKDHAVAMARFCKDILHKFNYMVKAMVVELGPDTEDLGLRVGIHSGPVTAGVLRGERARFQLFGDTMNTTARMESTGAPNKIQMSQETADLLIAAGKTQWLTARKEKVNAKGKGELQTYWLELHEDATKSAATASTASVISSGAGDEPAMGTQAASGGSAIATSKPTPQSADKHMRLISWNTDILARLLTQIIARRESRGCRPTPMDRMKKLEEQVSRTRLVLSEVTEIITLPKFESTDKTVDPSRIELSEEVVNQLRDYVQTLSAMYRENPFHNFEHASHVTMSVLKLLSRIVAPADLKGDTDQTLHDHTYGITSDPMTQFAVVLSALIHDADHPGVPNSQLIKENASIAAVYNNKSIAEQNSVDLAWDLLMDDAYADLRRAIYVTEDDFLRFRQLVVNVVLATDIMDKDLGALRKGRWNKAFSECPVDDSAEVIRNRKATIVMEHLIQASDVAHTMQHWHIYRKWNQRLFLEMYKAYAEGRAEKDPSESWFEGEKGFFDFYIIPLAKKLKDCGVFGVSSDEYLQYAQQNRKEWELKGRQVTAEMTETAKNKGYGGAQRIDIV